MTQARDFEAFYAENFRVLTMQLYAYCGNLTDAQDVVQEACCRALARWPKLSQYDDPAGWVRRVAWNLATSQWRRSRRLSAWTPEDAEGSTSGPTPDRVDLVSALAKLPARQRQVVVMHYLGDLSVSEIAELSQVPAGTVKSWMSRARTVLSAQLSVSDTIQLAGTGGRTRGGDVESFTGIESWPGSAHLDLGISLTDPLAELFEAWIPPPITMPGSLAAHRTVATWRRAGRR
ncbi:SigE family RNA polymerase sigma factor [Catelliglobosispora koreensis]|uniref:SigE family RNA polymerase sigma factor n=1 Tax=Catelliglobosispora koreensis TaxID=129052 RepID=UPI0003659076|nr:SigE family RNA polymerase sigma factor [Catelliglobosispora koreensis]